MRDAGRESATDPYDLDRFLLAQEGSYEAAFEQVLEKYFGGEGDPRTLRLLFADDREGAGRTPASD